MMTLERIVKKSNYYELCSEHFIIDINFRANNRDNFLISHC